MHPTNFSTGTYQSELFNRGWSASRGCFQPSFCTERRCRMNPKHIDIHQTCTAVYQYSVHNENMQLRDDCPMCTSSFSTCELSHLGSSRQATFAPARVRPGTFARQPMARTYLGFPPLMAMGKCSRSKCSSFVSAQARASGLDV